MAESVVLLEANAATAAVLSGALREAGFSVDVATEGREALELAARWQPDVVIVNVSDPAVDGLGTVEKLPVDPRTRSSWVIVLTSSPPSVAELEVATARAHDHVALPVEPADLVVRARAASRGARAMRELSPLTGMPGLFRLTAELEWLTSLPEPRFAVLRVAVDRFAGFNQHYGVSRGNDTIRALGRLIAEGQAHHRAEPTFAAHLGGDDFAVVTSPGQAEPLARWLIGTFDLLVPTLYDEEDRARGWIEVLDRRAAPQREALVTISIGVMTTARREVAHHHEALAAANEMLAIAREMDGSTFALDRRRRE